MEVSGMLARMEDVQSKLNRWLPDLQQLVSWTQVSLDTLGRFKNPSASGVTASSSSDRIDASSTNPEVSAVARGHISPEFFIQSFLSIIHSLTR